MEGMKVACLLGQGFEDAEFRIPYDRLREAGLIVEIIGTKAGEPLQGKKGRESVKADRGIGEVRPEDYAALLIPGGQSPDHLRADERFVEFVRKFDATGHPLAAVCHGPQLLITAGLVKGRTLTAWSTVQEDLRQIGAKVKDEPVVIDGNWITSRKPDDLEQFSEALLRALGKDRRARPEEEAAEESPPLQRPSRDAGQPGFSAGPDKPETD
jgi:protease I